jgi:hypothetical protein
MESRLVLIKTSRDLNNVDAVTRDGSMRNAVDVLLQHSDYWVYDEFYRINSKINRVGYQWHWLQLNKKAMDLD